MVAIRLTIAKGAQVGAEAVFEQKEILIGRTEDNDVVLLQGGVSREHARIYVNDAGIWVEDLGSANGTYLNGHRLEKPTRLSGGDELGIGSVALAVGLPRARPEPKPEPEVSNTHILGDAAPPPVRRPVHVDEEDEDEGDEDGFGGATAPLPGGSHGGRSAAPARAVKPRAAAVAARVTPQPVQSGLADEETRAPSGVLNDDTDAGEDHTLESDPEQVQAALESAATRLSEMPSDDDAPFAMPVEGQATRLTDLGGGSKAMVASARGSGMLERVQTRMLELPVVAQVRSARRARRDPDAALSAVSSAAVGGRLAKMDAVERLRLRRELQETLGGQLRLWWLNLEDGPRRITLGSLLVVLLVFGGVLWFVFKPAPSSHSGPVGPEPTSLTSSPIAGTFGYGSGVDWEHLNSKAFDFEFIAPTRVVAVLHFEAANIQAGELAIILNGTELGEVEADTAGVRDREHEVVLPLLHLRSGEPNKVIFENRLNPSERSSWQISRPWVEIIPVPELTDAELIASAREHAGRGRGFAETQTVGSDNLFKAWKAYRAAWITLEPLREHPQLYSDVRFRMGQLKAELDTLCGGLILDFERAIQFSQRRKAKAALQDILLHFPTADHRCHNLAQQRAAEHSI